MKHLDRRRRLVWIRFLIAIVPLIISVPVNAQNHPSSDIELTAEVSRSEILIADPFELKIQLVAPTGTRVSFPESAESLGPFEIINSDQTLDLPSFSQEAADDHHRLWKCWMSLETLETGSLEIPSIEVIVQLPGQAPQIRRTNPIKIEVAGVVEPTADLTQFQGVADLHDVPIKDLESDPWFWFVSIAGAIALTFAGGAFLLRQRTCRQVAAKAWALRKLKEIRDYDQAESIVRQYIQERFGFRAASMSADQVLTELRARGIDDPLPLVEKLLETSERVKFGGLELSLAETDRLLSIATEVVEGLDLSGGQA